MTLQELKITVLNNSALKLELVEKIGVLLCDNKEYIYKVLNKNK